MWQTAVIGSTTDELPKKQIPRLRYAESILSRVEGFEMTVRVRLNSLRHTSAIDIDEHLFYTATTMHAELVAKRHTETWTIRSNQGNTPTDPFTLECRADRLIRDTRAHTGDYPAYSERDLQRKADLRGEITISQLIADPALAASGGKTERIQSLLEKGFRLYDPQNPADFRPRIKPGYDMLLILLMYASDLTTRERTAIELTMIGLSPREVAERTGLSTSVCSRDLSAAISVMRLRRDELEKEYDLERTAKVLHLQKTYLPQSAGISHMGATSAESAYARKARLVMYNAVKPILVPTIRRTSHTRRSLQILALTLPESNHKRPPQLTGRPRKPVPRAVEP